MRHGGHEGRSFPRRSNDMDAATRFPELHHVGVDDEPIILDAREQPIEHQEILVGVRIDSKTRAITATPVVAGALSVVIAIVAGVASVWIYSITGAMSYQNVVNDVTGLKERVAKLEALDAKVTVIDKTVSNMAKDVDAIKEEQKDSVADRKKMMSDVADIRILLAQKGIGER